MDQAEYWYAVASVLLFFKMFAISASQGFHRNMKLTFKTPEDAAFVRRKAAREELPQVQGAARAWLNDLENIPIFLALADGGVHSPCSLHVCYEHSDYRGASLARR